MSSETLALVQEFHVKADELAKKGHILRAAENYGRAAEAARALGDDNLVAVHMRMRRGSMVGLFALKAPADGAADPCAIAAYRAQYIALAIGGMEALERRRLAGTLQDGKCAAAEEAWLAGVLQRHDADMTAAEAASSAALVGYEGFMQAANVASHVLVRARTRFAAECTDAHIQSAVQHVVHAADMMQQPRRDGHVSLYVETLFTDALQRVVATDSGLDARWGRLLADAWLRLWSSGVLQTRCILESSGTIATQQRAFDVAVQSSLTAPGLRSCALPGCGASEAHPAHFKSCAACRTVVYCCREHQVEGWPAHKKACKVARKAAAAEEGGAGPSGA